jgi:hypothetical protein
MKAKHTQKQIQLPQFHIPSAKLNKREKNVYLKTEKKHSDEKHFQSRKKLMQMNSHYLYV